MKKENDIEKLFIELSGQKKYSKKSIYYWIVAIIAFFWSLFQLYATYFPLNFTIVKSVHLTFAIVLAFLIYPITKKRVFLQKIPWYNIILSIIGGLTAIYIAIDYSGISNRAGNYLLRDIIMGVIFIFVLLEAGRRSIGIGFSIIAFIFLLYDKFGDLMPDIIAHKPASFHIIIGQLYLTTQGIFGLPLGVSAGFVFLFVLFGALLEAVGAGKFFIDLAYALFGRFSGGPAKASVIASGLNGIISGSSTANTATTGVFTIPLMKKAGLPPEKAAAIEVAASTNGQLMPPVMGAAAFIIAEFLGISYIDVIKAAIIPALTTYIGLFYLIHIESKKYNLKKAFLTKVPSKKQLFMKSIFYFSPVVYLLYTLVIVRNSPQMAVFNAIMFLIILIILKYPLQVIYYKKRFPNKREFLRGFEIIFYGMIHGAKNMIPIAIATAIAGIIMGSITLTGLGQDLLDVVESFSNGNILIVLILTALISLILGMGLPTTANYIVVASLSAPLIIHILHQVNYHIHPLVVHFFVFYFGILADNTPPVGIAAYIAAAIARANYFKTAFQSFMYDVRTAILPFMFFFNNELLLINKEASKYSSVFFITNPLHIFLIFVASLLGMFSFISALQGWFWGKRLNFFQRIIFLVTTFLFFLPNVIVESLNLSSYYHFHIYLIGMLIFITMYIWQKKKLTQN